MAKPETTTDDLSPTPTPAPRQRQDPWQTAKAEMETETEASEPNPLSSASPTEPEQPPTHGGTESEPSEKQTATADDWREPVTVVLTVVANRFDPPQPPTAEEVESVVRPLADADAPAWLLHWTLRLGAALVVFAWRRIPEADDQAGGFTGDPVPPDAVPLYDDGIDPA